MGATYSRLKTWAGNEDVTTTDLNAEFNNVLNNHTPAGMDDYSANTSQMRSTADPGESGSESLATSLQGEIERLRHAIKETKGTTYWYETPSTDLEVILSDVTDLQPSYNNRIVSGAVNSYGAPAFLVPDGSAQTVRIKGATTNLVFYVDGDRYALTTDVVITGLNPAPSSNNTATLYTSNGVALDNSDATKRYGEDYAVLTDPQALHLTSVGAELTGKLNKMVTLKLINAGNSEFVPGRIRQDFSNNYFFTNAKRGSLYNSALSASTEIKLNAGDAPSVELYTTAWVFLKKDFTAAITYVEPTVSGTSPTGPVGGDFWFDTTTNKWKKYSGASWDDAESVYVGFCAQSTTACVVAKSADFALHYDNQNSILLNCLSTSEIANIAQNAKINVFGNLFSFGPGALKWIPGSLDTGALGANTTYYLYVTYEGVPKFSLDSPTYSWEQHLGWVHPSRAWRCVGSFVTTAGSVFNTSIAAKPLSLSAFEKELPTHNSSRTITLTDAACEDTTTQLLTSSTFTVKGRGKKKRFEFHENNPGIMSFIGNNDGASNPVPAGELWFYITDIRGNNLTGSASAQYIKKPLHIDHVLSKYPMSAWNAICDHTFVPGEDYWIRLAIDHSVVGGRIHLDNNSMTVTDV